MVANAKVIETSFLLDVIAQTSNSRAMFGGHHVADVAAAAAGFANAIATAGAVAGEVSGADANNLECMPASSIRHAQSVGQQTLVTGPRQLELPWQV